MEAANNSSINYARPEVMSSSMYNVEYVFGMFVMFLYGKWLGRKDEWFRTVTIHFEIAEDVSQFLFSVAGMYCRGMQKRLTFFT